MAEAYNKRLLKYTTAEEKVLSSKLEAIRLAIDHPAEKGKAVELNITDFIRNLLPSEYGVSSGFIAYHSNNCQKEKRIIHNNKIDKYEYIYDQSLDIIELSSQLDIIIYDALRFGPIARLGTCEVFPAEAVFAYIEVKSCIDNKKQKNGKTDLENILIQSSKIRNIKIRQYHVSLPKSYTKTILVLYPKRESIQIRSYVFALEAKGKIKDAKYLCNVLKSRNNEIHGHLSGMYVYNTGFIWSHHTDDPNDKDIGSFKIIDEDNPLSTFKNYLYSGLYRFPRPEKNWTPAIDRYYKLSQELLPKIFLINNKEKREKEFILDINNLKLSDSAL